MKNTTFSIEEIKHLESLSSEEVIRSFKEYDAYTTNNMLLLMNVSTIDKSIYVAIMAKSMKQVEIVKATSLTKSHVSRMAKVGKWILENREQYVKLVNTAGTKLNLRVMSDGIMHDTISGVDDWASLVEKEKAYKESTKTTPKTATATPTTKPSSDKAKATPTATATPKATPTATATPTPATPKHAFLIRDFERMNSTSMYSAIIRMVDAYKASGDNIEYMNNFITRLNELKH